MTSVCCRSSPTTVNAPPGPTARDRGELHRRQLLGLVDDDVVVAVHPAQRSACTANAIELEQHGNVLDVDGAGVVERRVLVERHPVVGDHHLLEPALLLVESVELDAGVVVHLVGHPLAQLAEGRRADHFEQSRVAPQVEQVPVPDPARSFAGEYTERGADGRVSLEADHARFRVDAVPGGKVREHATALDSEPLLGGVEVHRRQAQLHQHRPGQLAEHRAQTTQRDRRLARSRFAEHEHRSIGRQRRDPPLSRVQRDDAARSRSKLVGPRAKCACCTRRRGRHPNLGKERVCVYRGGRRGSAV